MKAHSLHEKTIVLFDGVCNFCNQSVNFIIDRDKRGNFVFASLQSEIGGKLLSRFGLSNQELKSVVVIQKDKMFRKSTAALEIARKMDRPWPLFYAFKIVPSFIRNFVYDLIANNRYRLFGKTDECRIPDPHLRNRFL